MASPIADGSGFDIAKNKEKIGALAALCNRRGFVTLGKTVPNRSLT